MVDSADSGRQQLHLGAVVEGDHRLLDALFVVAFAVHHDAAQHAGVELDRGFKVGHGDADVVDRGDLQAHRRPYASKLAIGALACFG